MMTLAPSSFIPATTMRTIVFGQADHHHSVVDRICIIMPENPRCREGAAESHRVPGNWDEIPQEAIRARMKCNRAEIVGKIHWTNSTGLPTQKGVEYSSILWVKGDGNQYTPEQLAKISLLTEEINSRINRTNNRFVGLGSMLIIEKTSRSLWRVQDNRKYQHKVQLFDSLDEAIKSVLCAPPSRWII